MATGIRATGIRATDIRATDIRVTRHKGDKDIRATMTEPESNMSNVKLNF